MFFVLKLKIQKHNDHNPLQTEMKQQPMRKPFTTMPYNYRQRTVTGGRKGSRSSVAVNNYYNEVEELEEDNTIRKGPWKAEEDEVLINHVNKYGPREWSSIRSKGLLRRTGKSCRLRWVNKLRPNLKNGCKFSMEEERLVIEMQAQMGNKWARIATYLPGRTDNDVKNFWSSRQKRLARMRQAASSTHSSTTPPPPLSDPPTDDKNHISSTYNNSEDEVLSLQVPDEFHLSIGDMIMGDIGDCPFVSKPDSQCSSLFSAYISHEPESMRMVELPALMMNSNLLIGAEASDDMITTIATTSTGSPINEIRSTVTDHLVPIPHNVLSTDLKTERDGQVIDEELLLVEPRFMDVFGENGINDQLDLLGRCDDGVFCCAGDQQRGMIFGDQQQLTECCILDHGINNNGDDLKNPDLFFDDFPSDVFDDQMDSLESIDQWLPSPSKW